MRFLLIHSEDDSLSGPWTGQRWDEVFDLARSGWAACERWSRAFGCPVKPIDGLREGYAEIRRVRELLQSGLGRLVDKEGLDWWELTALPVHQQLESLVLLRRLAEELPRDSEVWITREGFEASALRQWLGTHLHVISSQGTTLRKGPGHYLGRLWRLPNAQVVQILGDKYDAGYRVRRHFHGRPRVKDRPVVLIPSAYVNVSLMGVAYARLLPEARFMLVSTRHSGRLREAPENVEQTWLAAYAGDRSSDERRDLAVRWERLKQDLEKEPELGALSSLGLMNDFPRRFTDGLAVRNAWLRLLNTEPVEAVLCGDDSNPMTHIPLLLGRQRGLPTIACHHGALDGRHMIKSSHADVILAKGKMEQDYLVQTCGVDASLVEIGAPAVQRYLGKAHANGSDWMVFFSEPYEATGGRAEEVYRDVVPGLLELAAKTGKKLVVKLHPAENLPDRQRLTEKVLAREKRQDIHWITGPLGMELLQGTWFGLTVQSSVAMECAIHGVPCFCCDWLDLWPYGYVAHYRKFGVGIGLRAPDDIARIPEMLADFLPDRKVADDCWHAIAPSRFKEILSGRSVGRAARPVEIQSA